MDHGIAAAADPRLSARLAGERTTLCVAPSGNVATGAVRSFEDHPLRRLMEAGVSVALAADDPLLFETTTSNEYRVARRRFDLNDVQLRRLAESSWRAAFCSKERRDAGLAALAGGIAPAD